MIQIGEISLAAVLMVILGTVYKVFALDNRYKPLLAIVLGMGLGLVGMVYAGQAWQAKPVIDALIQGLMIGASAVGLYEAQQKIRGK